MIILGLNAYHADASACLVVDGQLVAAAEEERFCRVKHWAGLPARAVGACLNQAGLEASAIDCIAVNRNPSTNLLKKADRKSTRLNSSHANTSYAAFCLKKKPAVAPVAVRARPVAGSDGPS